MLGFLEPKSWRSFSRIVKSITKHLPVSLRKVFFCEGFGVKEKNYLNDLVFLQITPTLTKMKEILLMTHVFLGVLCILASLWVFVDSLNASEANQGRIRLLSRFVPVVMMAGFVIAGYWYVNLYPGDKAIILKGPWPWAHDFFMETKEHLVLLLLLLTGYLPIVASANLSVDRSARNLTLWVSALIILIGLVMEGEGGVISMGVRLGLIHP
jgi:hypothetical protein